MIEMRWFLVLGGSLAICGMIASAAFNSPEQGLQLFVTGFLSMVIWMTARQFRSDRKEHNRGMRTGVVGFFIIAVAQIADVLFGLNQNVIWSISGVGFIVMLVGIVAHARFVLNR